MPWKYQEIWQAIKTNMQAEITVSRDMAPTLIQGVKRTKCADNVHRSGVGLVPWSKLVIEKELLSERTQMMKITFRLLYDSRV